MKHRVLTAIVLSLLLWSTASFCLLKSLVIIEIRGINCPYCLHRMQHALEDLPQVEHVFFGRKKIQLLMPDLNESDLTQINQIIKNNGYIPSKPTIEKTN